MNSSKEVYLETINQYLDSNSSIQFHADDVSMFRENLNRVLTPEENYELTSEIKNKIQKEALQSSFSKNKCIIIGATGVGKTKMAIDKMNSFFGRVDSLIVVPTQKLRDSGWVLEINKWGKKDLLSTTRIICYDSLHNVKNDHFDLVIFDECHNFTENCVQFILSNTIRNIMSLSATYPTNQVRAKLIREFLGEVTYKIDTDTAVKLGIVSPYNIVIVNVSLFNLTKTVKAGSKAKPFLTTETKNYIYLDQLCESTPTKLNYLKRMRFIYNLKSKEKAAKYILDKVVPQDIRTLIFAGSKDQADNLCEKRYYSKPTKPKKEADIYNYNEKLKEFQADISLSLFLEERINRLSCVEALNEGHNINNIDCGMIVQLNSNELNLIQRIGRCIRYRVNHTGTIIILCSNETVDKQWVKKATASLNMNTKEIEFKDLVEGKETINF